MNILELLKEWACVNSYSYNGPGLEKMIALATEAFSHLHPDEIVRLPFGLSLKKRAKSPLQIFLGGQRDWVGDLPEYRRRERRCEEEVLPLCSPIPVCFFSPFFETGSLRL